MSKLLKVLLAASAVVAATASAATITDIKAKKPYSAYLQDQRCVIARSGTGLCWHTGYWTPADAVPGCDGPLVNSPAAKAPAGAPVAEKVTFAADAFFDFNKTVVKKEGKAKLDKLVKALTGVDTEVIVAVGHTDWIGSDAYNQKLSERRAKAVKAYLVSKGVPAKKIFTEGKGEKQPIADNRTKEGRAKNRRVEVEVVVNRGAGKK